MNNSLDTRVFKILVTILVSAVVAVIGLFIYSQIVGDDLALPWHIDATYIPKPLFLEYFQIGSEPIGFYVDQYINWQQYTTGSMKFIDWINWGLLGAFLFCLWLVCTSVTYFSRFWYLVAVGVLILVLLQLNLIEIQLWNEYGNYLALGLLILVTYFFHAIRPSSTLSQRLLGNGLGIILYAILVNQFAITDTKGLTLISEGLFAPLILAIIFIVFVAGENIYSILKVATTKGGNGKQNLIHFLTFGLVYNIIVILFFLNKRGLIDFEISFLNPYLLLIISTVSAYVGFGQRFEKQKGKLPISLLKKVILPSMFILTLMLVTYAHITANDPLIDGMEYLIIIPHMAFGAVYFISAFINFTPLILNNLDVSKVFYKPNTAPMFLIYFGSAVFMMALVFYVNFYPYYQIQAGKFNALGDLSEIKGETLLAEQYYKQGMTIDFVNFKSNYQVAKYKKQDNNAAEAILSYENTFFKNGSAKGYTSLGNFYNSRDQYFNTLFELKEAKTELNRPEINNNLAFTYRQFNQYDSAYLLLMENWNQAKSEITRANLLALSTELGNLNQADSLIQTLNSTDSRTKANAFALANPNDLKLPLEIGLAQDTILLQDDLFLLFNASLNRLEQVDSTKIDFIDYYLLSPYNNGLRSFLLLAKAIQLYEFGLINQAFKQIELLTVLDNSRSAHYHFMLGIWSLHQDQRLLSNEYFNKALSQGFDRSEILRIQNAAINAEIPDFPNPFEAQLSSLDYSQDTSFVHFNLEKIASANAFDEEVLLQCIDQLNALKANPQRPYEILVEAHRLNKYSVPVFQAYILSAVNMGLSEYALNGLKDLSTMMPREAYQNFENYVEQKIEERRNQSILE